MKHALADSPPILSCAEAGDFEQKFFGGDEEKEWPAMQRAGRAVATAVLRDFQELGEFPAAARLLVLVGKGHNGGDALIAAAEILTRFPASTAEVYFVFGERPLRPLAQRAWRELQHIARARASTIRPLTARAQPAAPQRSRKPYDVSLDGVFGFQFRPPLEARAAKALGWANAQSVRLRAAVDLPSGIDESDAFRADFTYATGLVKSPVISSEHAGRVRYLDLGFFAGQLSESASPERVLTSSLLAPLAGLRAPRSDKRTYGHVFILGGSRNYPGAVLMSVLSALHSGVGLVTAFVPESLLEAFAARAPEAMWVGWPETPDGNLALEGHHLLKERIKRAAALVIGPGLGRGAETLALAKDIVSESSVPVVIDADALQPDVVRAGNAERILTPHAGEFERISGGKELGDFCAEIHGTVVLKGPVTRIASRAGLGSASGKSSQKRPTYHSFFGGPVLARGGSGDVLAGLTGGLLAQTPTDPLLAATRAVVWHGLAADALARVHGQTSVMTTQLLDFLPRALRESQDEQ